MTEIFVVALRKTSKGYNVVYDKGNKRYKLREVHANVIEQHFGRDLDYLISNSKLNDIPSERAFPLNQYDYIDFVKHTAI